MSSAGPAATTSQELARRWERGTGASGWSFPSDWRTAAIDAVCDAICGEEDVWPAAERLGRERAAAGVSLAETLADIDGVSAIVDPRLRSVLSRAVSLGWADRVTAPPSSVSDPLTGLVTPEYLQVRMSEVYREAESQGTSTSERFALVVVRLDLTGRQTWARMLPMILTSDAMRCVFDGGQTLAQLGDSVAAVLAPRTEMLARRARLLVTLIQRQVERDPQAAVPAPAVWIENLPSRFGAALDLVRGLGR